MPCQNCAKLSNAAEEQRRYIHTKRVSEVIRDIVNLAAEPRVTTNDVLDVLLHYVSLETDKQCPDLVCPEPGCLYTADTYQLLQRHYLRHVSYTLHCPFCSKRLQRVSQADSHLSRCNARKGRPMPENLAKRKLDAYNKLQKAHSNKKWRASKLTISDFATDLTASSAVCHGDGRLGEADSYQQSINLHNQVAENFGHGTASVRSNDSQSIHFSSTTQQTLAPGLVDNFADGSAFILPMLQHSAPQQELAPGLVDNISAGSATFSPMLFSQAPQQEVAPGLVDNFADGASFFPQMQQPVGPQQAVATGLGDHFVEGAWPFSPTLAQYFPAGVPSGLHNVPMMEPPPRQILTRDCLGPASAFAQLVNG